MWRCTTRLQEVVTRLSMEVTGARFSCRAFLRTCLEALAQNGDGIAADLQRAQQQLQMLQKENEELKASQRVITLADVAKCQAAAAALITGTGGDARGSSPTPTSKWPLKTKTSSRRGDSDAVSSWDVVSRARSEASTAKQTSLAIVNDFSVADSRIYEVLAEHFVTRRWRVVKEEGTYKHGQRPKTLEEIKKEAAAGGYTLEQQVNWLDTSGASWAFICEQDQEVKAGKEAKRPGSWPKTDSTRVDDEVRFRKERAFQEITKMVQDDLSEFGNGPGDKRLSEYLHAKFLELTDVVNQPVTSSFRGLISKNQRNQYMTKLVPKWTWACTKDVVMALWMTLSGVAWMQHGDLLLHAEKQFLDVKIKQDTIA